MAKSLRSKREKRLRTLRREIAEPFYDKKEAAKQAAQAAALEAPKLPVRVHPMYEESLAAAAAAAASRASAMEVDGGSKKSASFLKPMGTISKKKVQLHLKIKKDKRKARKKGNSGKKSY
ncbi:hypothetical protein CFC21_018629 [Triticum aestivum]|uniref:Uncharacterized protein n=4 Tax=Triticum TaxID=4564 RepID=A0A9R1RBY7_TRITD|nr:uncharacterized protein LOC119356235 [Triticum dicoccoides]XP_044458754.1 uncharacterized protein LOC123190216 [Triticum aestivum]EMS55783.1 hypothetical protein TRIUR3_13006 [Triticum urartu]KAF7003285.1 hypothetical protein CFC21_018629 [Triticum aestivum]VAH35774.1 unnamed protein product [Triticum turgidum subsp. durum]